MFWYIIGAWLLLVSSLGFIWCFLDKSASTRVNARRIPEMRFYITALLGGTPGVLLGMYLFRHKTKKVSFQAIIIFITSLQIGAVFYLLPFISTLIPS